MCHAGEGYPNISAGHVTCMREISPYLRWTCLKQGMDILISPLDMSHAREGYPYISVGPVSCRDGYPYISAGHVSCTRGISSYLSWTCLMQGMDILISPLDLSQARDGYPNISAGHVSCMRGIS